MKDDIHLSDIWNEEGDSINSKKKIELAKVKEDWTPPPRVYDPDFVECKAPITPLEYYDNEDGYWDDYIKEKESYRGTVPIPNYRANYKH